MLYEKFLMHALLFLRGFQYIKSIMTKPMKNKEISFSRKTAKMLISQEQAHSFLLYS